jgi:hypothetical protein
MLVRPCGSVLVDVREGKFGDVLVATSHAIMMLVYREEETGCREYISELLHLIQQPLCFVSTHAVGEADCSVLWDVGVGRVVRLRDAGVGDGAVASDLSESACRAAFFRRGACFGPNLESAR